MNFMNSMLGFGWTDIDWGTEFDAWVPTLMNTLETVLWVLLALVGAAGGIYALYVGIKMARADSAEAREENKKRLINIIVSIVVVIVLILFFNGFLPMILKAFGVFNHSYTTDGNNGATNTSIQTVATAAKVFLHI